MRRSWLCRSVAEIAKVDSNRGDDEPARGRVVYDALRDLSYDSLAGLRPCRLIRCRGAITNAVVFGDTLDRMMMTLARCVTTCEQSVAQMAWTGLPFSLALD